jgi:DNA-binding Xre family transcriptional regulator
VEISYKKLWKRLIDEDMRKSQLKEQAQISGSTLAKLSKNEYVSLDVLVRICGVLQCQLSDVAEIVFDDASSSIENTHTGEENIK